MSLKTILFHVPKKMGDDLKVRLALDKVTLRDWGNGVVERYLASPSKKTKPRK